MTVSSYGRESNRHRYDDDGQTQGELPHVRRDSVQGDSVRGELELEEDGGRREEREGVVGVAQGQVGEPKEPARLHAL